MNNRVNLQLYEGETDVDERKYVQGFRTAEESNVGWNPDYGEIYATTSSFRKLSKKKKATGGGVDLYEAEQRVWLNVDPATRIQQEIERFLYEAQRANVVFAPSDKETILYRFSHAPQKEYKHPLLFVLGFIMERINLPKTMEVAQRIGQEWVRETDVIRYYRLHQSLR
jgi:hypothetical protein